MVVPLSGSVVEIPFHGVAIRVKLFQRSHTALGGFC